ncbi:MAG: 3-dehydroquinate synthase, partial [Candidatus Omnitrophica bacterium]|nr:3-dehydroquinate synthase [Candidatus Omnitrophota bacterium]
MKTVQVPLGKRSYAIHLTDSYRPLPGLLTPLHLGPWGWVVSHRSLLNRFGPDLLTPLRQAGWRIGTITVPESERTKSYAMAESVIRRIATQRIMHVPTLFAFGGGVIGDLTGFVAAIYRRGVPYVQLPTTLLAQVDSAIGGKVGVDLPVAKNLVGAFYQPRVVFNHLGVLRTLPLRQRRSGLSEIIKYAAMADVSFFEFLDTHHKGCLIGDPDVDRVMIERCCRIKARVVGQDEQETTGVRTLLNFGHTLGHALEAATGYQRFTHGEAIAIGMACASQLSVALDLMPPADHTRLIELLQSMGLPVRTSGVSLAAIRHALQHDKKFIRGTARWVLLTRIGNAIVHDAVPT